MRIIANKRADSCIEYGIFENSFSIDNALVVCFSLLFIPIKYIKYSNKSYGGISIHNIGNTIDEIIV